MTEAWFLPIKRTFEDFLANPFRPLPKSTWLPDMIKETSPRPFSETITFQYSKQKRNWRSRGNAFRHPNIKTPEQITWKGLYPCVAPGPFYKRNHQQISGQIKNGLDVQQKSLNISDSMVAYSHWVRERERMRSRLWCAKEGLVDCDEIDSLR